jgi:hypothetical protein
MTTVKKQYEELYTILEANKNKKVSSILPQLIELMSKKNNASGHTSTFIKNEDGDVVAIFCYYHKKWEYVNQVEFGLKKSSSTGYNTMCKEGVSKWTKQQRVKKLQESELLTKVSSGELKVEDIAVEQTRIIEESKEIIPREDGHGYDELSDI